jgi:hypothetical protein
MDCRIGWKSVVAGLCAIGLAACAADTMEGDELGSDEDEVMTEQTAEETELASSSQALGSFSHKLPLRGSFAGVIDSQVMGNGMMYGMQLRTGALVDAVTVRYYVPRSANNRYAAGDLLFTQGPVGGSAGSVQPLTECPGGYAAYGLFGGSGNRLDRLGLICAQIDATGRPVTTQLVHLDAFGGTGGTSFYDTCGEGKWLSGFAVGVALKSSGSNKIISYAQGRCENAR